MKLLFVTPVIDGTGETVTSLHMAKQALRDGHEVAFLASHVAASLVAAHVRAAVTTLGPDLADNQRTFRTVTADLRPDVVVWADWPLLFFPRGVAPLARADGSLEGLGKIDSCLVTLDHFGFAQMDHGIFVGPPHLSLAQQRFPRPPPGMRLLLPCPMHSPRHSAGRRGMVFRYWDLPLSIPEATRRRVRRRWLTDANGVLVLHAVAAWSWRGAEMLGLPLYRFLPRILEHYLSGLGRRVTVLSVNNGSLLAAPPGGSVRFVNLAPMPTTEFEELLFSCDLLLTENRLSISMGKAVCGLQPCGVLKNSHRLLELVAQTTSPISDIVQAMESVRLGSVYPHDVFPTDLRDVINEVVLYRDNPLTQAFAELELYGGDTTRKRLQQLLTDCSVRQELRARQETYVGEVAALPTSTQALARMLEEHRSRS